MTNRLELLFLGLICLLKTVQAFPVPYPSSPPHLLDSASGYHTRTVTRSYRYGGFAEVVENETWSHNPTPPPPAQEQFDPRTDSLFEDFFNGNPPAYDTQLDQPLTPYNGYPRVNNNFVPDPSAGQFSNAPTPMYYPYVINQQDPRVQEVDVVGWFE